MTKKQYEQMKQAARRDARKDVGSVGLVRIDDYVMTYSKYSGYSVQYSPFPARPDTYAYARACRRLAQFRPGTSGQQLADCKQFLEDCKK